MNSVKNLVGFRQKLNHIEYGASLAGAGSEQLQSLFTSGRRESQIGLKSRKNPQMLKK